MSLVDAVDASVPLILIGGGGHARSVLDAMASMGVRARGVVAGENRTPLPLLGDDSWLAAQDPSAFRLVSALGSTRDVKLRARVFDQFSALGFEFVTIVHRSAVVSESCRLDAGVVVMAGTVLQAGVHVHRNAIVNTGAQLDHDCVVGAHTHVAPGVVCSGGVRIGARAHVGTAAVVIEGVSIGDDVLVGAGSLVLRDVAAGRTVFGHPAKERR